MFNVLLQVLDDGRVTDSQGRTVDFKNTVVIMTSNIGSVELLEGIDESGQIKESARSAVMQELHSHFRPEFLNRVDDTILFKPLCLEQLIKIVDLQLNDLSKRLADRDMVLECTEEAKKKMAEDAYDPAFGARPLKRYIQRNLETKIGRALIEQSLCDGSVIKITVEDGELMVKASAKN